MLYIVGYGTAVSIIIPFLPSEIISSQGGHILVLSEIEKEVGWW